MKKINKSKMILGGIYLGVGVIAGLVIGRTLNRTNTKVDMSKMDDGLAKEIIIKCGSSEEMCKIRDKIHDQLVGNIDYIDSNIVLNDGCVDENSVWLGIFKECKEVPDIKI